MSHEIKVFKLNIEETEKQKCRAWRDDELARTDSMLQFDRPDYQAILDYRVKLRDYPNEEGFPNVEKPKL